MRISLDPPLEMDVLWYHVDPASPMGPAESSFRSQTCRPFHADDGQVGEVDTGKWPWASGAEFGPEPVSPFAGSDSEWLDGV